MAGGRRTGAKATRRGYARAGGTGAGGNAATRPGRGAGFWALLAGGAALVALVVGVVALQLTGPSASSGSSAWVEQGPNGGSWTNVGPDELASMMTTKDFTLLNVKTPYIGEIAGTDLYIPYDQLAARASELPADKAAKIVVYCRAGNESRVALATLAALGYTNLWNLDKGMESWTASGRSLIQKSRT